MAEPHLQPAGRFRFLQRHEFGLLFALAAVFLLTAILDSQHNYFRLSGLAGSLQDITRHTSMLGIYAIGAAIVIIAGGIDLSAGSVIAFSGTICASIMLLLAPEEMLKPDPHLGLGVMAAAIGGTLLVGLLIGSLHAWLITMVGLPPFIATLATLVGLRSFARAICAAVTEAVQGGSSSQINVADRAFRDLGATVHIPLLIFLGIAGLTWLLMSRTVLGRHLHALGGNEEAARLSGIRTDRLKWFAYCTSAVLSSIAGILIIGLESMAKPQDQGVGYELQAIAAAVVGGCSLRGGVGTVPGTVLGALFMRTVIDGINKVIKVSAEVYEGLIVGVVVVVAVAFSQIESGQREKRFLAGRLGLVAMLNLTIIAAALAALVVPGLLRGHRLFGDRPNLDAATLALLAGAGTLALLAVVRTSWRARWKALVIAVLGISVLGGAILLERQLPVWRYHAAVRAVERAGGQFVEVRDGHAVDFSGTDFDDARLRELARQIRHITDLTELRLSGTQVTDAGMNDLKPLALHATLRRLDVSETAVTRIGARRVNRALPDADVIGTRSAAD
jgi:ribose/xylose/arabinose/galactoside ABC-type transport system permease subunit